MKRIYLFLTAIAASVAFSGNAQRGFETLEKDPDDGAITSCATGEFDQRLLDHFGVTRAEYEAEQRRKLQKAQDYNVAGDRGQVYVIPVVVHIMHENGPENLPNQEIYDMIDRLNIDYRIQNTDLSNIVTPFDQLITDPEMEFALAQYDPNGNCTPGITRTFSPTATNSGDALDCWQAQQTWNTDRYLNVYVTKNVSGGAAAYYTGFGDFIVCGAAYIGANQRTMTHEVGHWASLGHVWGNTNSPGPGQGNCNSDDGIGDTPNTEGELTAACNTSRVTCGSLDNTQNYMDYSGCPTMFTAGQVNQMRSYTASNRSTMISSQNGTQTGATASPVLCAADFSVNRATICEAGSVDFTDMTYNGASSWSWSFTGGTPSTSTAQNPTVTYNTPGVYEVSLTASNGATSVTETKSAYITVLPANNGITPFYEGFEGVNLSTDNDWFVANFDGDAEWETTTDAAATGSTSARLMNTSGDGGKVDQLISNTYDLRFMNDVTLSFKYAFAQRTVNGDDNLKVYVSNTCGATWSLRNNMQGTTLATASPTGGNYVPSSNEWVQVDITNIPSTYLTNEFRFMFEFTSDGGNNIYIDDINLDGPTGVVHFDEEMYNLAIVPNPAVNNTVISFDLSDRSDVTVNLVDMTGRTINTLMSGSANGAQRIDLNTTNLSKGMYFVQVQIGGETITEKLMVQ